MGFRDEILAGILKIPIFMIIDDEHDGWRHYLSTIRKGTLSGRIEVILPHSMNRNIYCLSLPSTSW